MNEKLYSEEQLDKIIASVERQATAREKNRIINILNNYTPGSWWDRDTGDESFRVEEPVDSAITNLLKLIKGEPC